MARREGKCVICSAPSGAGKTTIVHYLLRHVPELSFSVSATSRPMRPKEKDGVDYHFLSQEEFEGRIAADAFVEWEEVYPGRYYGTLRSEVERIWASGKDIIFDVDVVGGRVDGDGKAGRDAGEVCGDKPWHITTTQSVDDIISLKPDCVVFCENGDLRPNEVIDRFCQLLEHGINVVSTSIAGLVHHNGFDPGKIQRLNRAGHDGGASLYVSGMEPGFAADQLVLVLTTLSRNIRSIRTQEIFLYDKYPVVETMRDAFGFGLGPGHTALVEVPNDYTKSIIEHRVNDTVVRTLSAQIGREVRLAVAID